MKNKKRILSAALAVLLGVSTVLPTANVFAANNYYPSDSAPYKFNLSNHHTKADFDGGKKITGAKYDLKLVGKMLKTGAIEPGDAVSELTKATIDEVNQKELNTPGRYELTQVERPFGYLLGQGTDADGKALDKVVVDFPVIDDQGQISKTQVYNIAPKFNKVEKDFSFTKLGHQKKALKDVGFNLYALNLAEEGKYKELYGAKIPENSTFSNVKSNILVASGKTGEDGKIVWNQGTVKLAEGSYFLEESSVPDGYRKQNFFVTLKAKAGLERTAAKIEDFEFVITKTNADKTVVSTDSSDAASGLSITNYNTPTPGNGDGTSGGAEFSKKIANIGDKTTVQENQDYKAEVVLKAKDHAQFQIKFTTPEDAKSYAALSYTDSLRSEYTLLKDSVVVKAGNETNPSWVKVDKQDKQLKLTLIETAADAQNVKENQEVIVEFVVKVNRDVATHGSKVDNGLVCAWSTPLDNPKVNPNGNDPDPNPGDKPESPQGNTPIPEKDKPKAEIINSKTVINAKDLKDKTPVDGSFVIEKKNPENGKWEKVKDVPEITTTGGTATIEDLPSGEYRIVNTKVPTGYPNKKPVPQTFEIKEDPSKKTIENERTFYFDKDGKVGILPSTGTLGTLPYLLSATLLLGVFVALRKRNAEER